MKRIQKGSFLLRDDDTKPIYKKFKSYFKVERIRGIPYAYSISKEPSEELVEAINSYYAREKEKNRPCDEYIDRVAKEVLEGLSEKDKEHICFHPDSSEYHFGLGMYIRNKYIYKDKLDFDCESPDDLSGDIVSRIASLLIDDYDFEDPYYRCLYDDADFTYLRRLYYAANGEMPDALVSRFAEKPNVVEAVEEITETLEAYFRDEERLDALCAQYGVTQKKADAFKAFANSDQVTKHSFVPYDLLLLAARKTEGETRTRYVRLLKEVLIKNYRLVHELPQFLFGQKDAVLVAVGIDGKALKRFPRYKADDDVIRAALANNGEAIQYVSPALRDRPDYIRLALSHEDSFALKMRCMAKYRDNDDIVRMALEANGCNIRYASFRLRDDLETARFAVTHQKNCYPDDTVCNLSRRLRDSLEIALLDIREGHHCIRDYSVRLRDSDEVARELISRGRSLYWMSERIQKKYKEKKQ